MDSERTCCVPNCKRPRSPGTPLHGFPNPVLDPDRFRTWLYNIGGDILALDNQYIYKYRNVCRHHFKPCYHFGNRRLTNNAIPTLNMPGLFATRREPMVDITNRTVNVEENIINMPSTSRANQPMVDITRQTVNVKENINMPSTSRDIAAPQTPLSQNCDLPKTTLRAGGIKNKHSFKNDAKVMAQQIAKLRKVKDSYSQRLKKALKLSENPTFLKTIKSFSTMATIFTLLQFREINKPKMGRRFTQEEKIMALSLYKHGPKAYRWMSKVFVLPSYMTLSRLIARASLKPGINENIFEMLKKVSRKMKEDSKLCVLLFDEIALSPHFDYSKRKDRISGFVDNGKKNLPIIADHALVFMIRGVYKNYKQPISYTFCSGSTKKDELVQQIKENISQLQRIGFKVLATVCDQGASNVSALNQLIEETRGNYLRREKELRHDIFIVNDQEVIPLYDAPHLIKGIRNNLITKNLKYKLNGQIKIAKWEHLKLLHAENPSYKGISLVKNLSEAHVNPEKMNKQKVKYATQIFSQTVASSMGYLAEKGVLPQECTGTADILLFFDELFDSINGSHENSKKRSGKELLRQLTPNSNHEKVWNEAKKVLGSMKFVAIDGRECTPPSITNFLKTINNFQYLKKKLFDEYKLKSIWLRHFNQDPLENFFGCIRSHGAQNTKPSCAAFEDAFASLLINNLNSIYSPGSNCEEDSCEVFTNIGNLLIKDRNIENHNHTTEINFDHIDDNIIEDFNKKKDNPIINSGLNYVTGYVLRKASKIFKTCTKCKNDLYTLNDTECIKMREYNKSARWLTYPSSQLVECFSAIQDFTINILRTASNTTNIRQYIKTVLFITINMDFITCEKHKPDLSNYIFDLSSKFFICNWCRNVNKLLKGARTDFDDEDVIEKSCYEYFNKRKNKN